MKAFILLTTLLLAPGPAEGRAYVEAKSSLLPLRPVTEAGRVEYGLRRRAPASVSSLERNAQNRQLCEKMRPGQVFMIKNSVHDFDDRIVTVADRYEDCSVRVKLENGQKAYVRFQNLSQTLAPEVDCVPSHGTLVCKGDQVFYPARTSSMEIPEAPIEKAFAHGVVVVRDGADFVLNADQVGKPATCAPGKENICLGKYVHAEAFKVDRKFDFEGKVARVYTNDVAVVETGLFKYPIAVAALKERIATDEADFDPSVITRRNSMGMKTPFNVMPTIEPNNARFEDGTGLSIPAY